MSGGAEELYVVTLTKCRKKKKKKYEITKFFCLNKFFKNIDTNNDISYL